MFRGNVDDASTQRPSTPAFGVREGVDSPNSTFDFEGNETLDNMANELSEDKQLEIACQLSLMELSKYADEPGKLALCLLFAILVLRL